MKQFFWCGGLVGIVLCHATLHIVEAAAAKAGRTPAWSTPKAPAVTRGNFVSLEMQTSGGIAGIQEQFVINGNIISKTSSRSFSGGRTGNTTREQPAISVAALSNNQLDALVRLLNEARFTSIVGTYNQPQLRDGFNEVVTLKLSDDKNMDRTFVVQNYGDQAPAAYYKVTAYLRQLQRQKFAPITAVADAGSNTATDLLKIDASNFERLEFVSGGGISNLQTTITIRSTPFTVGAKKYNVTVQQSRPINSTVKISVDSLSDADFNKLFQVLNEANFPLMAGKYTQPNLADGINDKVFLTLRDANGTPKVYVVENYGDQAPQPFYTVVEHLRQLLTKTQAASAPMDYYRAGNSVSF